MPITPVITSPANGSSGLGPNPRFYGTAEPNYSVELVQANTGVLLGQAVTEPNGQWSADLNINTDQWVSVQARCYVSPSDPNSYSAYSAPITIQR